MNEHGELVKDESESRFERNERTIYAGEFPAGAIV